MSKKDKDLIDEVKRSGKLIVKPTKDAFSETVLPTKDGTKKLGRELIVEENDLYLKNYLETLKTYSIITVEEMKNG